MKLRKPFIFYGLAVLLGVLAGAAIAQSGRMPVPSGIFAAGDIPVASNSNHLVGLRAVAAGQVLTSAGTGTSPAWSASPALTSATIGSAGTAITQIRVYSQTITPASVATIVCAEQTFTVTGLTTADKVLVNPAATGNATSMAQARVSAADTLALMYCNPTAGALVPGAGTYTIVAFRS